MFHRGRLSFPPPSEQRKSPCQTVSLMRDASCYQLSTTITNCNETTERHGTDKSCLHSRSERERESSKASVASGQNNISAVLSRIKLQLSWRQLISQTDSLCYFPLTHNISEIKVSDNEDRLLICKHSGLVSRALTTIDIWQIFQLLKFYQNENAIII